ncbi:carbohydrate-binding protein [Natronoflexus pectinivorans]|uniref:Putative repeat protein (TIGR02059 family)/predicted secreted protein (Por secretion system target) n=1 Tax=Natronoflexus pectinivorans TaxID=682526 RepID=A0A4R2GNN7_9BACT|nr:carbohydrate-binding protein [Natronoflexus pectinivorans]TCO10647.1 putative repeat protein (TIGR02059 family)/predicted secreted protein (Por secretion system target) [Natronoflexus pectinivorans]
MKSKSNYFRICCVALIMSMLPILCFAQIENIQVGEQTRRMLAFAPSDIESNRPLMISMHGMNQDINYQKNMTRWEDVASEHNFVVVYPEGLNSRWSLFGSSDIDFILAIIDEMHDRYAIDRDRVYLSGFSMGGMMTYYAATQIADKIAAFAPVGGYLMQGPNTNSSRPIPLIHTHGTTDDVVVFGGVQTAIDVWVARNNCPETPEVIQPYPAGMSHSNTTKYIYGPGTDQVEVVLLKHEGVGHWHSMEPVNTSEVIWQFCRRFSLGFGIPKVSSAFVIDDDPNQVVIEFSLELEESSGFDGFTVEVDGSPVDISSIELLGETVLAINLEQAIINSNQITISYNDGNVTSVFEKELIDFSDLLVENFLHGSSPRIIEIIAQEAGQSLVIKFNKEMLLPSDIDGLILNSNFNGLTEISINDQVSFLDEDPKTLVFELDEQVFADYELSITYTGTGIAATDDGLLNNVDNFPVNNKAKGLPVTIESAILEENAIAINLKFAKAMRMGDEQLEQFRVQVNGQDVAIREFFVRKEVISLVLANNVYFGDEITISYTPGDIVAADQGELSAFIDFAVENKVAEPSEWTEIPARIQAENYTLQFGTDTETTSDVGGGINVGWIDSGDWLVYAIDNKSDETEFQISFRLAAEAGGRNFDIYIDDEKVGQINVPNTGGWQTWQTVTSEISLKQGQQYLKLVATSSGFNINYFDIEVNTVGFNNPAVKDVLIYHDPSSRQISIRTNDLIYNNVKVIDLAGNVIVNDSVTYKSEKQISGNFSNGVYIVKISNGEDYFSQKVTVLK